MVIDDTSFEHLFIVVSNALDKDAPLMAEESDQVALIKTENNDELSLHLTRARKLQYDGKIQAYAHFKILSHHYLCLVGLTEQNLLKKSHLSARVQSKKKSTLNLQLQGGELVSLNPHYLGRELQGRTIAKFLFEGLTRLTPSNEISYAGCESITVSEDKKRYLFKLRPHFWSDGTPVTAFQYEKSWKTSLSQKEHSDLFHVFKKLESKRAAGGQVSEEAIKALDPDYLQIKLSQSDSSFLHLISFPVFFPSRGLAELRCFNGPYCIGERTDERMVLEKNPYYWGNREVFFDKINVFF